MKKKNIWITIIVLSVLFIIQIPFNIHNNAYYYATHMPHKKSQYPFTNLLDINYLPPSNVPGYQVKNNDERDVYSVLIRKKGIQTKTDIIEIEGNSIVYSKNYHEESYYLSNCAAFSLSETGTIDGFDKSGTPPKHAKKVLHQSLDDVQNQIKKNASKPLINIQWIWNIWFKVNNHD